MFRALLLGAALAAELPDAAALADAAALLKTADAPRQAFLHSTIRMRVAVEQDDGSTQTGEFELRLGNENQQLVIFRDKRNQGRKFLTVGDKSWLIVPGSKNPIAVTANQRMMGASSFADIARIRLASDYTGELRAEPEPCGEPTRLCRVVDIRASVKTAPYASGTLWIDTSGLLRKAVYKLASGKPAKEILYRYKDSNGATVPAGLILNDLLPTSTTGKTTLDYLDRRPADHPAATFDPQQQVRR
jgi:hypothetical protein